MFFGVVQIYFLQCKKILFIFKIFFKKIFTRKQKLDTKRIILFTRCDNPHSNNKELEVCFILSKVSIYVYKMDSYFLEIS